MGRPIALAPLFDVQIGCSSACFDEGMGGCCCWWCLVDAGVARERENRWAKGGRFVMTLTAVARRD